MPSPEIAEGQAERPTPTPTSSASVDGQAVQSVDIDEGPQPGRHLRRPRFRGISLTSIFLGIAIPLGAFLVFAVPPFQGLDEPNHFIRVYSLSQGVIVPPTVHSGPTTVTIDGQRGLIPHDLIRPGLHSQGVVIDGCLNEYVYDNYTPAQLNRPMDDATFWRTPAGCAHAPAYFVMIDNTAINSPVVYAPQLVGVTLLRVFGAPLPVIFYGGRLFGLAAYLAIVALAIRIAPRGKPVLFLIGLLPMSLEGAAGYSADTLTLSLSMLLVALTLRCCLDEEARWPFFVALATTAWGLALCKEPYGLLALLVLLVPAARLTHKTFGRWEITTRWATALKVTVVAVAGLLAGVWWLVGVRGSSLTADYPPGQIDPSFQAHHYLHDPLSMFAEIARTLGNGGSQQFTLSGMVSSLGFFRVQNGSPTAPIAVVVLAFVALAGAYLYEVGPARRGLSTLQRVSAWLPVALAAVLVFLIYAEYAIRLTPPGSTIIAPIHGVQGRLFLPMVGVPVATVALLRERSGRPMPTRWLVLAVVVLGIYMVTKVFARFY